jgi:hypothetical protein
MSTPPSERSGLEHELADCSSSSVISATTWGNPRPDCSDTSGADGARELAGLEGRMEELRAHWAALPDGD